MLKYSISSQQRERQAGTSTGTSWRRQDAAHSFFPPLYSSGHASCSHQHSPLKCGQAVVSLSSASFWTFHGWSNHGAATDGHRRSGTACKYVLWRRWSCGFWRRSSLWSPIFSFLSPVVCSVIGPPWECLKQNSRVCSLGRGTRDCTALREHRAKTVGR